MKDPGYLGKLQKKGLVDMIYGKDNTSVPVSCGVRLTKKSGDFYAPSTMSQKYISELANKISELLNPPITEPDLRPMDNEPSMRQTQPQQISPEALKLLDDLKENGIKAIKHLEDLDKYPAEKELFDESALRELRGLLKAGDDLAEAKQVRDMKIMELQDEISKLNRKNFETEEAYEKEKKELMDKLIEEKKRARDISLLREPQTTRIRRLFVEMIKKSNLPLKDKLQIIFKIEGITIGSIITAVVTTITSIALAISLSLKSIIAPKPKPKPKPDPQPGPGPKPDPSKPTNPVKEGLKKFAEWLKELAKKSFAALPAIIGSIVSFILKSAAAAVGFLAEHMIILVIIIVSSIVYGLAEGVRYIKKSGK